MVERIYTPRYNGPIAGFSINYIRKNIWRVPSYVTEEDLVQDSHLIFLRLRKKYKGVDNPRWFMALFKNSFINHINDLSKKRTKAQGETLECEFFLEEEGVSLDILSTVVGEVDNDGAQHLMIEQMPPDIRSAVSVLLNCKEEVWNLACEGDKASNQLLCSWIGKDHKKVNIIKETKSFFT